MLLTALIDLLETMSVLVVVAYVLTRSRMYMAVVENRMTARHRAGIIVLFSLFSIYGTIDGVQVMDATASIRDLGPAVAGLIGGPLIGLATGFVGAAHRYLQGGFTALPCSLATLLAGVMAGFFYWMRKGDLPRVRTAMLFMAAIELAHMGLVLLISRPFEQALLLVWKIILPMVAANAMGIGLFAFIVQNLKHEKAVESAKHVIEGELKAAREIQMGILPKIFPPFPQRCEFDLYAVIEPAREVGGDFYDFFFVDEERLCLVIGDVSGKGVPAALFMAVTKTLIKAKAIDGENPDQILGGVNGELSQENGSAMFATVFCAILNTRTGALVYANGGHNPPYVVTSGGAIAAVDSEPGPIVGALGGITYGLQELKLRPGDSIFLYTDGVTEAMDRSQSFFSVSRLEEGLACLNGQPVKDALPKMMERVRAFCGGAEQSDDITMMMVRFKGG